MSQFKILAKEWSADSGHDIKVIKDERVTDLCLVCEAPSSGATTEYHVQIGHVEVDLCETRLQGLADVLDTVARSTYF